jgi:hypothetical protein
MRTTLRRLETYRDGVRERKINLKLRSRTPSLLQDCASLSGMFGFNCGIRVQTVQAVPNLLND